MKEMKNLVDHYNQWFKENEEKRTKERPEIEPVDIEASVKPYFPKEESWRKVSEMRNLVEELREDSDYKSFPGTSMYVAKGVELHAKMEKVIRESLSDFDLDHLEVKVTQVGESNYSVEVEYGEDSSLIGWEKTSQLDKSNKFKGCDKWKMPEGGQVRLLKDCSSLYRHHYRVNTETKVSPEDVEKIKESWRKAWSTNICHEIKKAEEPMEEEAFLVKKNVIGIDWGEGALEKYNVEIAEPVSGSDEPERGMNESRGVCGQEPALEAKSCGCVGSYICWDCKL